MIDEEESENTMGSVSSISTNSTDNIILNFKKSLGERKTPKKLNILNRLIIFILVCMITLQSVNFVLQLKITDIVEHDNWILYNCQLRAVYMMYLIQYSTNFLILAEAGKSTNSYPLIELNRYVDRFTNAGILLQTYAGKMQQVYSTIHELRSGRAYPNDKLISEYEYQTVPMYMIDEANIVQLIYQPYRVAMEQFLINLQILNNTSKTDATLSLDLLYADPSVEIGQIQVSTTLVTRTGWYAMVNSVRSLRTFSDNSTAYYQQLSQNNLTLEPFVIVLIVGAIITVVSIVVVLYLIWINERIQEDILSLYQQIQLRHIVQVYNRCHKYMVELQQRSYITNLPNQSKRRSRYNHEESKEGSPYNQSRKKHKNNTLIGKIYKLTVKEIQYVNDQNALCREEEMQIVKGDAEMQQSEYIQKKNNNSKKHVEKEAKQQVNPKWKVAKAFKVRNKMTTQFKKEVQEEEKEEDNSNEDSSRSSFVMQKDIVKRTKSKLKKRDENEPDNDLNEDKRLQQNFNKSFQTQNIGRKLLSILLGFAMFSHFIIVYKMQGNFNDNSQAVQASYAPIFNRQIFEIITIVLQKDRVYYNNSLTSFDWDPVYGYDIDMKVYHQSIVNEQIIADLKQNHAPITNNIVNNLIQQDSPNFCNYFIGSPTNYSSQSQSSIQVLSFDGFNSYQHETQTVIAACRAAFNGDIITLQSLFQSGVDLNQADYSMRSPLYYAVRGNQSTSVQFLINCGVNLNQADLWQGKPLDYATVNSTIYKLLVKNKATIGSKQTVSAALPFTLTDNQVRMFYAAYHDDVLSGRILSQLNLPVNAVDIDGRTTLHVVAMQGNHDFADFLTDLGADGTIIDAHGNDALQDAKNGNFVFLSEHILASIIDVLVKQYCTLYDKGLLTQGELSVVGLFEESAMKLYIDTLHTPNYDDKQSLLKGFYTNNLPYTDQISRLANYQFTIQQYIGGFQDLYLSAVFADLLNQVTSTISSMNLSQNQYIKVAFALFIIFEVFLLIFARRILMVRLREDILESRGILNMIPNDIIYQNKNAMESIIKKLQD